MSPKKTKKKHCGRCGKPLGGVESKLPSETRKLSKSEKVPERTYAGVLCVNCLEDLLRYKVRWEAKFSYPDKLKNLELRRDLTVEKFLPKGWYSELTSQK